MSKVSIIIPSRNEPYLEKTVNDLFKKAKGYIEVIVALDGDSEYPIPTPNPNLIIFKFDQIGKYRNNINKAAKIASGEYLMKIDSHVAMSEGFDEELKSKHMGNNWISVPRRYDLDVETWKPLLNTKVDYYYLGFPWGREPFMMRDMPWYSIDEDKEKLEVDDLMTFGGTCWFLNRSYFLNTFGGLSSIGYGNFIKEAQELIFKTWLGGGRVIINKNVWCAHFGQPNEKHPFKITKDSLEEQISGSIYSATYWTKNKWKDRVHDFNWLIEKFWPLPSPGHRTNRERYSWPENWRDYYEGKVV